MSVNDRLPFQLKSVQQSHLIRLTELTLAVFMADKSWFLERIMHPMVEDWEHQETTKLTAADFLKLVEEVAPSIRLSHSGAQPVRNVTLYYRMIRLPYTGSFGKYPPFTAITWGKPLRTTYPAALKIMRLEPLNMIGPKWLLDAVRPRIEGYRCLFNFGAYEDVQSDWDEWKK